MKTRSKATTAACIGLMAAMGGCASSTKIAPASSTVGSRTLIVERAREVPPANNSERGGVLAVPVYADGWADQ